MNLRIYIRKPVFYLVLVLIALLPLSKKAELLIFGKRTTGTVVDYGIIDSNNAVKFRGQMNVSMISYTVDGTEYLAASSMNVVYDIGKKVTIIYDKDDPNHSSLLTFTSLYSGYGMILAGFVLLIWMAFYLTWGAKDLPRKKGHPTTNWPRIE